MQGGKWEHFQLKREIVFIEKKEMKEIEEEKTAWKIETTGYCIGIIQK